MADRRKHGIDFVDAQRLWDDPNLLEIPARTADEPRFVVIGLINLKHWSAVITYRENRVRVISVRRARAEEVRYMKAKLKAARFDKQFDEGKDVLEHLDVAGARRVKHEQKRVNVDFPTWMIELLGKEASRVGVTRQSIIKLWLAERLERTSSNQSVQTDQSSSGR